MNAFHTKALAIAANKFVAVFDEQSVSLEVYKKLKVMAEDEATRDMCMTEIEFADRGSCEDQIPVHELVGFIEAEAQTYMDFGNSMLAAAHTGLIEAAIDGSLDSDANSWDLRSLADSNCEPQDA